MLFLADENFNNDLLRRLRTRYPSLDIIRVQDTEVYQAADPILLAWAAQNKRILLTHDIQTIPHYAYERVASGLPMPGIIEVRQTLAIGDALEDLILLILAGTDADFDNQVRYIPLS
jgi:hypothetical protein